MNYSKKIKQRVAEAPRESLGNQLGRWAIARQFSIIRVAECTGATRQTCYNWFLGNHVARPYRDRVTTLIKILRECKNADEAWGLACEIFNLEPSVTQN